MNLMKCFREKKTSTQIYLGMGSSDLCPLKILYPPLDRLQLPLTRYCLCVVAASERSVAGLR